MYSETARVSVCDGKTVGCIDHTYYIKEAHPGSDKLLHLHSTSAPEVRLHLKKPRFCTEKLVTGFTSAVTDLKILSQGVTCRRWTDTTITQITKTKLFDTIKEERQTRWQNRWQRESIGRAFSNLFPRERSFAKHGVTFAAATWNQNVNKNLHFTEKGKKKNGGGRRACDRMTFFLNFSLGCHFYSDRNKKKTDFFGSSWSGIRPQIADILVATKLPRTAPLHWDYATISKFCIKTFFSSLSCKCALHVWQK